MPEAARPAPILTDDNAAFWDAARDHRLVAQRCASCGRLRHPPRPMCPHCRSLDVEVVELGGRGTVYSFSIIHYPPTPFFDYPVLAVLVDLDEGIRLVSNLVDVDPATVDGHVARRPSASRSTSCPPTTTQAPGVPARRGRRS